MHEMLLVDQPKYATMSLNNTQILKVKQLQNRNKEDNNWQKINTTFSNTLSISGRSNHPQKRLNFKNPLGEQ